MRVRSGQRMEKTWSDNIFRWSHMWDDCIPAFARQCDILTGGWWIAHACGGLIPRAAVPSRVCAGADSRGDFDSCAAGLVPRSVHEKARRVER